MELVLDTNIYRNLVRNLDNVQLIVLARDIKKCCEKKGIKLLFPINSAMELISHFNDNDERERTECRNALFLLGELSTTFSTTHIYVDFVPPLNAVLERYFGSNQNTHSKMYSKVITVAQMLNGNISAEPEPEMNKFIDTIKGQLEFEKQAIRDNYEDYLKSINKGDADWTFYKQDKNLRADYFNSLKIGKLSFLVAQSLVDRAYSIIGIPIDKNEKYLDIVITFMQEFCPALAMNELLLENIGHGVAAIQDVRDGRWNTIIDISLIFGALYNPNATVKKLVTEEGNIQSAYHVCGFEDKIIPLIEFKTLLEI